MKHADVAVNGIRLAYVEAPPAPLEGLEAGAAVEGRPRLVVLLHGFPERWHSFRPLMEALSRRGMRVVAVELRGYGRSSAPRDVAAYDLDVLAADVAALVAALGHERADLVGHDWGGAVAWHVAALHPARVRRLVALSCPPAERLARALLVSAAQRRRSWYMFFFQLPRLPERWLAAGGALRLARAWGGPSLGEERARAIVASFRTAASLRAPVDYYRAAVRRLPQLLRRPTPPVAAPTLAVMGRHDGALGVELLDGLARYVSGPLETRVLDGVGHFLHEEAPDVVSALVAEFFDGARDG